jgi:hypothetical protein
MGPLDGPTRFTASLGPQAEPQRTVTLMSDSPLPPLYDRWYSEFVGSPARGESQASCLDCAMLPRQNSDSCRGDIEFHPGTKCCTYTPILPNYLVGAALADPRIDEVNGRESLGKRIDARIGVLPAGLLRPPLATLLYKNAPDAFGHSPEMRCPHFHEESGKCGIWLHRNAVCSTWFCKHDRGKVGLAFWHSLRDLLGHVESDLSKWCIAELGAPFEIDAANSRASTSLDHHDLAGTVSDREYEASWGTWAGREKEFYDKAAAMVSALSWSQVLEICGPQVALCLRDMNSKRQCRDTPDVPVALLTRKLEVIKHGEPTVLATYSQTDPLAVPEALLSALQYFRGQPVETAIEEIAEGLGIKLDAALIARLADFGVLAETGKE